MSIVGDILEEHYQKEMEKKIDIFADEITTWMKGKKYITVDETSTEMTEEFETEHKWELSRNCFIEQAIREIADIAERMKKWQA